MQHQTITLIISLLEAGITYDYYNLNPLIMKATLSILVLLSLTSHAQQVISRFTWTSNPLTTATVGPNATSVSTSATSVYVGGTIGYAINPGLPTKNVDLIIPGTVFNVDGIEIDLYFRREESVASFFKRGNLFNFQMDNGSLKVIFTTTQGSTPGNLTINSGNILTIANDHAFHNYRFRYDNNTGVANVWVDNVIVYTYTGIAGRPLAWTGAGDVIVGEQMDATSNNIGVLANLTVRNVSASVLPVELISFTAKAGNNKSQVQWSTTNEVDFSHFIVERAADGKSFSPVKSINATGGIASVQQYRINDESPLKGINYYRLKMVDKDGAFRYSDVVKLDIITSSQAVSCFPNPATNYVSLTIKDAQAGTYSYSVSTLQGQLITASAATLNSGSQQIRVDLSSNVPSGVLIIRLHNKQNNSIESFKIVKG